MTSSLGSSGTASPRSLLWAEGARLAVDDVVALDRLTIATRGERVLVLGDAAPLLAALTGVSVRSRSALPAPSPGPPRRAEPREPGGECRVVAGKLLVAGVDVATSAHLMVQGNAAATVGAAPLDPPMPRGWTAMEYVVWSARLAGHPKGVARDLAAGALERVGLQAARAVDLQSLDLPSRRALVLAHAIVTSPRVLVAEAPFSGLDGSAAMFVMRALAAATEGRGAIVSQSHIDPGTAGGSIARGASDVLVFAGGELAFEAAGADVLGGARLFAVTVRSNAERLRAELGARGIDLRGGPLRFAVTLPHGLGAKDILAAAAFARAAVVDVYPLLT